MLPAVPDWVTDAKVILDFRRTVRYRTDEEADTERRQMEEYAAHMESGFNLLRTELVGKTRADIEAMFQKMDRDHSASIDQRELDALFSDMGVHFTQEEVQKALVEIDADDGDAETQTRSDGEISFDELLNWLLNNELWVDPGFELIRAFYADDTRWGSKPDYRPASARFTRGRRVRWDSSQSQGC